MLCSVLLTKIFFFHWWKNFFFFLSFCRNNQCELATSVFQPCTACECSSVCLLCSVCCPLHKNCPLFTPKSNVSSFPRTPGVGGVALMKTNCLSDPAAMAQAQRDPPPCSLCSAAMECLGRRCPRSWLGSLPGRKRYVGAISAWPYSQHHKARACHHVPLECPIILPRDPLKLRHDGALAASKHKFSALEKPRGQEADHSMGSDPAVFGSGSGQAFVFQPFQKREFLWQLRSAGAWQWGLRGCLPNGCLSQK